MASLKLAATRAAILSFVLLLAGCGGGGGSDSSGSEFTIAGTLSGLKGASVILRLNDGLDLVLASNGAFHFSTKVAQGGAYAVTVKSQPISPSQTCTVADGTGTATADVSNVTVSCTTSFFKVKGTLTGLSGGSVVLQNNGGDDITLSADGAYEFATPIESGAAVDVKVLTQPLAPAQTCVVTGGTGVMGNADTNIPVKCTINTYKIGGTVSGLSGTGLKLRNNGGNDLTVTANGAFTFSTAIASGTNYLVTVFAQPTAPSQSCSVTNDSGTVAAADITSVSVSCVNLSKIGGTVRGLDVPGLVLRNSGGDDLTVNTNGTFQFATAIPKGTAYAVTAVAGTPASPRHVCQVVNGTDTVSTDANVTNVDVTCEADRFAYVAHFSTTGSSGPGLITALVSNHETGALTPIAGTSTFATAAGAIDVVSDPRGRFIYVANYNVVAAQNSVSGYSVNPATGALTPVPGSPFAAGTATQDLAIDSAGKFLYAANTNSDNVSGWAIQDNGSLTPVPGSPYALGDASMPVSLATSPAGQRLYVTHSAGSAMRVSAFAYDQDTGALTPLTLSPHAAPGANTPSSIIVNNTGERVYLAASGTSNITTFDIASGTGALTEHASSPTAAGNAPCSIYQPPLSSSLFAVSGLSAQLMLFGEDPGSPPAWLATETMFSGSYCSVGTDPYGKFVYVPKFDGVADYLFGFQVSANGATLEPLTLNPVAPTNTYALSAQQPRAMVLRYSRRDREMLQIPE